MNKRALLAILAHPDDESFGIGGTLARYAREGVDVHVAIATDGNAGSVIEEYEPRLDQLVRIRMAELEAAVDVLGATLHRFCYRDSGYLGDPANDHPDAFINADEGEAVGRVVALIRQVRPQVIITHDETGGYFHPDHMFCCKIATAAFRTAGDPNMYLESGPSAYQPQRLYYTAFPRKWVKFYTRWMRLRGQDPTKIGRNNDIDLTKMGEGPDNIHVAVDIRAYWDVKREASAQHVSQGGGAGLGRGLPTWLLKRRLGRETFMRAFPPVKNGFREKDLFAEIEPLG
jgi:mycothiol S-conjugate amidase